MSVVPNKDRQWGKAGNQLPGAGYDKTQQSLWGGLGETNQSKLGAFAGLEDEHLRSIDYRREMTILARQGVYGLINRVPNVVLRLICPMVQTGAVTAEYSYIEYKGGWMGTVPEEGLPRLLTFKRVKESKALIRRGLSVRWEATSLNIDQAMEDFDNMQLSVGFSGTDTMAALTIKTLMQEAERASGFVTRVGADADPISAMEFEAENTGVLNADPAQFVALYDTLRTMLSEDTENDRLSGGFNILAPRPIMGYIPNEHRLRGADEGVPLKTELQVASSGNKVSASSSMVPRFRVGDTNIWEIPDENRYSVRDNRVQRSVAKLMAGPMRFAEFYIAGGVAISDMYNGVTNKTGTRYSNNLTSVILHDFDKDKYREIPFYNALYYGRATHEPEPINAGYKIEDADFKVDSDHPRRRVPWNYFINKSTSAAVKGPLGRYRKAIAWGQNDFSSLVGSSFETMVDSMLAAIAANCGGANMDDILNDTQMYLNQMGSELFTPEYVRKIAEINSNFARLARVRDIDPETNKTGGWPNIQSVSPNMDTGTLNMPKSGALKDSNVSFAAGFASFNGLLELRKNVASGTALNRDDAPRVNRLVAFWQRAEEFVSSVGENLFLQHGLRPWWFPRYITGSMAMSLFWSAGIPLFVQKEAFETGPEAGVVNEYAVTEEPFLRIGSAALTTGAGGLVIPAAANAYIARANANNATRNIANLPPVEGSLIYGRNVEVVVDYLDRYYRMPADLAYALAYSLPQTQGARTMGRVTLPKFQAIANALEVGSMDRLKELVSLMEGVLGVEGCDEELPRKIVTYVFSAATSTGAFEVDAALGAISDLTSAYATSLKKLNSKLAKTKLDSGDTDVGALTTGILADTDSGIQEDFHLWQGRSTDVAAAYGSDYPLLTDDISQKRIYNVVSALMSHVMTPGSNEDAAASPDVANKLAAGKLGTSARAVYLAKLASKRVAGGSSSGTWVSVPLVATYTQAIDLVTKYVANDGGRIYMLPGDPKNGFLTPYFGNSAMQDFRDFDAPSILSSGKLANCFVFQSIHANAGNIYGRASAAQAKRVGTGLSTVLQSVLGAGADEAVYRSGTLISKAYLAISSDNFVQRAAQLPTLGHPARAMAGAFCMGLYCDSLKNLRSTYKAQVHIPLAAIIFMPAISLNVASMLMVRGQPGNNFYGDVNVTIGTEPVVKVVEMAVTMRHTCMITKRDSLIPAMGVLVCGYEKGANLEWISTKKNPYTKDAAGSIFPAIIPESEVASLGNTISPIGRLPRDSTVDKRVNYQNYSSAQFVVKEFDLGSMYKAPSSRAGYRASRATYSLAARQGQTIRHDPNGRGFTFDRSHSIVARRALYPGCKPAATGNGKFLDAVKDVEMRVIAGNIKYEVQPLMD